MFCCDSMNCNIRRDFENTGKIQQCYESAVRRIKSMDIVVVTEWLNDIRTAVYVNQLWWNLTAVNDRNFKRPFSRPYPHKENSRGFNYMHSEWVMETLREWNRWDIKLYHFVREWAYTQMHSAWQPQGSQLVFP